MKEIKIENRKSVTKMLNDCPYHKEHDFIEVTEWVNGEGWDITISDSQRFSLHWTEFEVLKKIIKYLEKN